MRISRRVVRASRRSPRAAFRRTPASALTSVRCRQTTDWSDLARGDAVRAEKVVKCKGPSRKMPHKTLEARREYNRRWRKDNAASYASSQERYKQSGKKNWTQLFHNLGVTKQQYEKMLRKQGGVCAACGQPETRKMYGKVMRLAVDHDHVTEEVRALLCSDCNTALGLLKECPIRILKLLRYIRKFSSKLLSQSPRSSRASPSACG